jgi:hypothetical protein
VAVFVNAQHDQERGLVLFSGSVMRNEAPQSSRLNTSRRPKEEASRGLPASRRKHLRNSRTHVLINRTLAAMAHIRRNSFLFDLNLIAG